MKLVLVGGIYKSGTSAACLEVESKGFRNPCEATGASERGHGIAVPDYATRECVVARSLNDLLLASSPRGESLVVRRMALYLREMKEELGTQLVVKDPRMTLTAGAWFNAARLAGDCESLELVATTRSIQDVIRSLQNTRFMKWKMRRQPELFRALSRPLSMPLIAACRREGAEIRYAHFSDGLGGRASSELNRDYGTSHSLDRVQPCRST